MLCTIPLSPTLIFLLDLSRMFPIPECSKQMVQIFARSAEIYPLWRYANSSLYTFSRVSCFPFFFLGLFF